jgi:hypothetical protein
MACVHEQDATEGNLMGASARSQPLGASELQASLLPGRVAADGFKAGRIMAEVGRGGGAARRWRWC